jgi:hypothetical protein
MLSLRKRWLRGRMGTSRGYAIYQALRLHVDLVGVNWISLCVEYFSWPKHDDFLPHERTEALRLPQQKSRVRL